MRRGARSILVILAGAGANVACGSSSGAPSRDSGATLSPSGDPPSCATPGLASHNPPALAYLAGALDASGTKLVVFGGDTAVPACGMPPSFHQLQGDTWLLDVGCGTWSKVTSSPAPSVRSRQAMALDPSANAALLFGGSYSPGGKTYAVYGDVWAFDFPSRTWFQVAANGTGPTGRGSGAAVVDAAANRLIVFGGNTSTSGLTFAAQSDTWALDLGSGVWARIAMTGPQPPARQFHAMAIDRDARVAYIFAGVGANAFSGPFFSDVWALDLASERWSEVKTTGTGPGGRIEGALVFDGTNKRLIAFAGHDDGAIGNENDVFALDTTTTPATWSKLAGGDAPGSPGTGVCMFPADFAVIDKAAPERRSAFAYGPRVDGRGFAVFAGVGDCGNLADSWWWSAGSQLWTTVQASPVGLSCLRFQTSCTGLC